MNEQTFQKKVELCENKDFAITISPSDRLQYFNNSERMQVSYITTVKLYKDILNKYLNKYELYLEVSPKGRIHYHGTINIKDIIGFLLYVIPQLENTCNVCIKNIDNADEWKTYYSKQQELVRHYLREQIKVKVYPWTEGTLLPSEKRLKIDINPYLVEDDSIDDIYEPIMETLDRTEGAVRKYIKVKRSESAE